MNTPRCESIEAQLPLLHYGELSPGERAEVLAHLESCRSCREAQGGVETTARLLDAAPEAPVEKVRGLRHAVLAAIEADVCPYEADVLVRAELEPDAQHALGEHLLDCPPCQAAEHAFEGVGAALSLASAPPLTAALRSELTARVLIATGTCAREAELLASADPAHVSACEPCSEAQTQFARVGAALDRLPVPMPSAERFAVLRDEILVATGAAPARAGTVIPLRPAAWSTRFLSAAAALLIGLGMGLTYQALNVPAGVAPVETLASAVASDTPYQEAAMRSYQRASVSAPVQIAQTPEDVLISYEDVIVEFPGTAASLLAIKSALADPKDMVPERRGAIGTAWFDPTPHETSQLVAKQLQRRPTILRFDYTNMRKLVNHEAFIDPRVRQSILLRQAMDAEELSVLARNAGQAGQADVLLTNARDHYRSVLKLDPDTKAAFLAREGLRRLS